MNIETTLGSDVLAQGKEISNMEKTKLFNLLTMAVTFLALMPLRESNFLPPPNAPLPLCATQISLANYACSALPFTPRPPPTLDNHSHGGHRRRLTPQEENCCRWAKEVDNECIRGLLLRMPPFLARPLHQYTLNLGGHCEVTYSCGGTI